MPTANDHTTPGELIHAVVRATGGYQDDLARLLGVHRTTVVRWGLVGGPTWLTYALLGVLSSGASPFRAWSMGREAAEKDLRKLLKARGASVRNR